MSKENISPESSSELSKLIARYEEHLKKNENVYFDAEQLADIADRYASETRYEDAQQVIDYGLRLHPDNTDLLIEQSLLYLDTDRLDLAKEVALNIDDNSEEVILLRGELLLNEEKPDEAEALFQSIYNPKDLEQQLDIASLYKDTNNPGYALDWLERALINIPENEDLMVLLAECYGLLGRFPEAVKLFDKLIDKDPFSPDYWIGLAQVYLSNEEYDKALNAIEFSFAAGEPTGSVYLLLGHIYLQLDRQTEAIEAYNRCIEFNTIPPVFAYIFIGLSYNSMEDWENAHEAFSKAVIECDSNFPFLLIDIYCNQANALANLGRYKEAHKICKKARKEYPDHQEPLLIEGYTYLLEDKDLDAWKFFMKAIDVANDTTTWLRISEYYLEFGYLGVTVMALEQVLILDPEYVSIHSKLAALYLLLGMEVDFEIHNELSEDPIPAEYIAQFTKEFREKYNDKDFWKLIKEWRDSNSNSN